MTPKVRESTFVYACIYSLFLFVSPSPLQTNTHTVVLIAEYEPSVSIGV